MLPTEVIEVRDAYQLDYELRRKIVRGCGGWIRSSGGPDGDTAEVIYEDIKYVFSGRGLIDFLYAVKDDNVDKLYETIDLCEYIAKSAGQQPSVFVRDAIVQKAADLKAKIQGGEG